MCLMHIHPECSADDITDMLSPWRRARIEKAPNLKLAVTAGIGSDHVDLHAAADHGMTVGEGTGTR